MKKNDLEQKDYITFLENRNKELDLKNKTLTNENEKLKIDIQKMNDNHQNGTISVEEEREILKDTIKALKVKEDILDSVMVVLGHVVSWLVGRVHCGASLLVEGRDIERTLGGCFTANSRQRAEHSKDLSIEHYADYDQSEDHGSSHHNADDETDVTAAWHDDDAELGSGLGIVGNALVAGIQLRMLVVQSEVDVEA